MGDKLMKKEKHTYLYLKYIILSILVLFLLVLIINFIMVKGVPFKVAQDNDWIGFWGGLLGAILSGIITFIVLKVTIDNENIKRANDIKLIEEQRLDDRRMSVLPYLNYTIVDNEYIESKKIKKYLETILILTPKTFDVRHFKIDCQFNIVIESLGPGLVLEPRIVEIYYDGQVNKLMARNNIVLSDRDKARIEFNLVFPEKLCKMKLKLGYFNLLRDYYEQEVVIGFQGMPILMKNELEEIVKTEIKYSPKILEINRPQIIEDYKLENLEVEIEIVEK